MATKKSVIEAWETKLGIKDEYRLEEVKDVDGVTVYHLISRNGSVTAAARSLEKLEKHAGEAFVEPLADTNTAVKPVEIDNSKPGAHDEPTKEEADRLRNDGTNLELSGNDNGETAPQDTDVDEHVENREETGEDQGSDEDELNEAGSDENSTSDQEQ